MTLRWFISATVRQATDLCHHAEKMLAAQKDILSPEAVSALSADIAQTRDAIRSNAGKETLEQKMTELDKAVGKWIKRYPNAAWRENVEVFLVAIAVAMAIRTFFVQPFKIPTGSMQPTLYGVTTVNKLDDPNFKVPGFLTQVWDAVAFGRFTQQMIAEDDGEVVEVPPVGHVFRFINQQTIVVQYHGQNPVRRTLLFAPDNLQDPNTRAYTRPSFQVRKTFHKGEPIISFVETTGDHLFVDRVTYNFRKPSRGEIVVFKTKGIQGLDQSQFYIKRLVGLPGEHLSIGLDRHARINGVPISGSTPHFENIYSFDPAKDPQESHYSGHILQPRPDALLRTPDDVLDIRPDHYSVFGDNTANSLDSRFWGDFPQENVIGKSWFVYWPFTKRFGWGQR